MKQNTITIHEERIVEVEENAQDHIEGINEDKKIIFYTKRYEYDDPDTGDYEHLSMHLIGLIMDVLSKIQSKIESKRFYEVHCGERNVAYSDIPGIEIQNLTVVPQHLFTEGKILTPKEIKKQGLKKKDDFAP